MTKTVYDATKETLNCMKGSGIKTFTTNDVVDKCFQLFYSDSDWTPNESTIQQVLVRFKKNESRDNFRKGKITSCGKVGQKDLLTWV